MAGFAASTSVATSLGRAPVREFESAKVSQGHLKYQRGNFDLALQELQDVDVRAVLSRLQDLASSKSRSKRRSGPESGGALLAGLQEAAVLFESVYLQAKCLQKLGRLSEAAEKCKDMMSAIESGYPKGLPKGWSDGNKFSENIGKTVELLPEILMEAGLIQEAITAFRRALLGPFDLEANVTARISKEFALILLYGGVEALAPSLSSQSEGAFIPKSNIEESILLLSILLRKATFREIAHDPTIIEHLTFALSICGRSEFLAHQYEVILPGVQSRSERWYNLALCYSGASQDGVALSLMRKSLSQGERPNDVFSLLLGAKLCARDPKLAKGGITFAERAVDQSIGEHEFIKGTALHILGVVLGCAAQATSLRDIERTQLHARALSALQEAVSLERDDPKVIFDLGLEYAEQRTLDSALDCVRKSMHLSGSSSVQGWKLLALIFSAQQRLMDAEGALDAALDNTGNWEQGELLRMKAKVQMAQGQSTRAIETYRLLLALVQVQRKSDEAGTWRNKGIQVVEEVEVWQGLAATYTSLKQWHDAEVCLEKAQALKVYSPATWHAAGVLHEAQENFQDALAAYNNALAVDPDHVQSKVSTGALLIRRGGTSLPVARTFLVDALRSEPKNHQVFYNLGMLHKAEGRVKEAADYFQTSCYHEQLCPVEGFYSISKALFW